MTCPTCGHTEQTTKVYVMKKYLEMLEEKARRYDKIQHLSKWKFEP